MTNIKKTQSGRRKNSDKVKTKSERRTVSKPRRKSKPKDEKELYNLPESSVKEFIEKERRLDELDIINEVREQKKTWRITMIFCVLLNLGLLLLAFLGSVNS